MVLKYHVGFPLESETTRHFIIFPKRGKKCCFKKIGGKEEKEIPAPESLSDLKIFLKCNSFYFYGITDNHSWSGDSDSLAYLVAGNTDADKIATIEELNNHEVPVFLFSGALSYTDKIPSIECATIKKVTSILSTKPEGSLLNKWRCVEDLYKKGKKVFLFLHYEDAGILSKALSSQKKDYSTIHLDKEFLKKVENYGNCCPAIVPLQDDTGICDLKESLKISFDEKKESNKSFLKWFGFFVFMTIVLSAIFVGGFYYFERIESYEKIAALDSQADIKNFEENFDKPILWGTIPKDKEVLRELEKKRKDISEFCKKAEGKDTQSELEELFKSKEINKCNNYRTIENKINKLKNKCALVKNIYENMKKEEEGSEHFDKLRDELKKNENKKCSDYEDWKNGLCAQYGIKFPDVKKDTELCRK